MPVITVTRRNQAMRRCEKIQSLAIEQGMAKQASPYFAAACCRVLEIAILC
jgi:hypothetical protein